MLVICLLTVISILFLALFCRLVSEMMPSQRKLF